VSPLANAGDQEVRRLLLEKSLEASPLRPPQHSLAGIKNGQ
jgi:hypothetical protein